LERLADISLRLASEWALKYALRDLRRDEDTDVEYFILIYTLDSSRLFTLNLSLKFPLSRVYNDAQKILFQPVSRYYMDIDIEEQKQKKEGGESHSELLLNFGNKLYTLPPNKSFLLSFISSQQGKTIIVLDLKAPGRRIQIQVH